MLKLPPGYIIPAHGSDIPGTTALTGTTTTAGQAYPPGGGTPITWDDEHGAWRPPGYEPDPSDPGHYKEYEVKDQGIGKGFAKEPTGNTAYWDDEAGKFIDTKTGKAVSYAQK